MPRKSKSPAVIHVNEGSGAAVREIAAKLGLAFVVAPSPDRPGVLEFRFEAMDYKTTLSLTREIPADAWALRLIYAGPP